MTINYKGIYDTKDLQVKSGYIYYSLDGHDRTCVNDICIHAQLTSRALSVLLMSSKEEFEAYLLEERLYVTLTLSELRKRYLNSYFDAYYDY